MPEMSHDELVAALTPVIQAYLSRGGGWVSV